MTTERTDGAAPTPTRLDASHLHPELRRAFRRMPTPPIHRAWQRRLMRSAMRLVPAAKLPDGVRFEQVAFPTDGTGVRVFRSAGGGNGGALLWIHGGGLVIGAAAQDDRVCADLAATLDVVVVSVEYRLAPEHPFPAPLDDCLAAWQWLQDAAAARRIDPTRIAVGGQSAGGGLAAALAQRLHDAGGVQPAAQWLFCPMLDDRTAARRELDDVRHFLWNNRANRVGWSAYLGTAPGATDVPSYAVPARRTDVAGLAPAWIGTGDVELFFEEDRDYALALQAAGVDCTLDVVAGGPHAFESLAADTEVARAYHRRAREWLGERLEPAG